MEIKLRLAPDEMLNRDCSIYTLTVSENIVVGMRALMQAHNGVGLAAPQIGIPHRFFVTMDDVFVNPSYSFSDEETEVLREGCLSIPGVTLPVRRYKKIYAIYRDGVGALIRKEITGIDARIYQHEVDHLDGILFPTRFAELFNAS